MKNTTTIQDKKFILFLTGNCERFEFDERLDFERAKKEAEKEGNGFKSWLQIDHNNETLIVSMDY